MMNLTPLFVGGLGGLEIVAILFVAILLFGAQKIPELARATGQSLGEFQKGRQEIESELETMKDTESSSTDDADASEQYESHAPNSN